MASAQYGQFASDGTLVQSWFVDDSTVTPCPPGWTDITASPGGRLGYKLVSGVWCPSAPIAQSAYAAAIAAGVQIVSASTPAISGTYSIDAQSIANIEAQQLSILTRGLFTNGQTTRNWLDVSGTPHVFPSCAAFTTWAEAVGLYVDQLQAALAVGLAGGAWVAPANPVNIA